MISDDVVKQAREYLMAARNMNANQYDPQRALSYRWIEMAMSLLGMDERTPEQIRESNFFKEPKAVTEDFTSAIKSMNGQSALHYAHTHGAKGWEKKGWQPGYSEDSPHCEECGIRLDVEQPHQVGCPNEETAKHG